METILIKALQLILSLSILVIIHEFGHFLFARLFKIRVEKFYLFFNPWFSLFKFKPKNSDTTYGIGWVPLGGYVKIAGMIDESMDKEQMAQPVQPWEFRSKTAWQRLLVMVGGVLFNFILAIIVYGIILFSWGDSYIPVKSVKNGMTFSQTVKDLGGYQEHDIILSIDGEDMNNRSGVLNMNTFMQFLDGEKVVVEREGKQVTLTMPEKFAENVIAAEDPQPPYYYWMPTTLDTVYDAAKAAGLQKGDNILSINDKKVTSWIQVVAEISKKENKEKEISVMYMRDSLVATVDVPVNEDSKIGIGGINPVYEVKTDEFGFLSAIPSGAVLGIETLKGYVAQMRFVFSSRGVQNLSGFAGIGNLFPPSWDWHAFWSMTAFLSIVLAFMNILPIPALDGGHIMFLLYEVITRRQPNEKFVEYAQKGGMIFLLLLLLVANGNDIIRIFFK
jgi:regulator of sigma E protease